MRACVHLRGVGSMCDSEGTAGGHREEVGVPRYLEFADICVKIVQRRRDLLDRFVQTCQSNREVSPRLTLTLAQHGAEGIAYSCNGTTSPHSKLTSVSLPSPFHDKAQKAMKLAGAGATQRKGNPTGGVRRRVLWEGWVMVVVMVMGGEAQTCKV